WVLRLVGRPRVFLGECPGATVMTSANFRGYTGARGRNQAAKGEPFERPVASVSRETAARAPKIPAGHGPAVQPTSRGSCRFPGRREVRRAAWFRPLCWPAGTCQMLN